MGRRVCLFVRVSTVEQHLESQETLLRQAALADGYNETDCILIGNKESAIKLSEEEREGLNELKSLVQSDNIDCVYIAELSRLSRQPETLYSVRKFLLDHKVQLKCLKPQFTLLTDDRTKFDPNANIIFSLFGALAEQEMIEKKERFARGKKQKAIEGKYNGGNIPFGYRINKDRDNLIEIDEEQSLIVQEIYNLYEKGVSQPKIAAEFRRRGQDNVTISLVSHVLKNASYTGVARKSKYASYFRSYPVIISPQQFQNCRRIANQNNVRLSKARNVYYAEHLVRCPNCGSYWSPTGSKVSYHCSQNAKSNKVWALENHKGKKKCSNSTSISINILDCILWEVAHKREASLILCANQQDIDQNEQEAQILRTKLDNIKPRIQKEEQKKERLREMYVDGLSRQTYNKKNKEITEAIADIIKEEKQFKKELQHVEETIASIKAKMSLAKPYFHLFENGGFEYYNPTVKIRMQLEMQLHSEITSDIERKKIIQRHIKEVEVIPTLVRFPFKNGVRDSRFRKIIVHCFSLPNEDNEKEVEYYTFGNAGKGLPLILDVQPDEIDENTPMLYSYLDNEYCPFEDIAPSCFEIRFRDVPKKVRRDEEKQKNLELIGNRVSLRQASSTTGISYWKLFDWVKKGIISSQMIVGKYYVSLEELKTIKDRLNFS